MKTDAALPAISMPVMPAAAVLEDDGELNFAAVLKTLRRKWWLIAGATAATTAIAGIKTLSDAAIYSGLFEILVQEQSTETEVLSDVPDTLTTRTEEIVDGDLLKLLRSPNILQPVVDGMRSQVPSFCPTVAGGGTTNANYDPCYDRLASRLLLETAGSESQVIQATFQDLDPETVAVALDLLSAAYLDYSLASKQADVRRALDFVEQKLPDLRSKVDTLQSQLQNLRLDNNLIDPDARGSQLASQVSKFSDQQLEVQAQLTQLRGIAAELQQQARVPQEQASSSVLNQNPRYQSLLNSLLELDAQIAEASTIYLPNSPDMLVLTEQRDNLVQLLATQEAQSQREVQTQIRDLEKQERAIAQTLQGLNANVDDLSGISRSYTDIERELQIATNNLNQFLSKREALQIDAAQREVPWEIVTPPTTPDPQPANLPRNLLFGAAMGLLIGAGASLLLDKSAGIIHSDEAIRKATQLPILARIPVSQALSGNPISTSIRKESASEPLQYASVTPEQTTAALNGKGVATKLLHRSKHSIDKPYYNSDPFSEAFRLLLTNLQMPNAEKKVRSVTVSSSIAGEGKSTVAIYLAEAAAAMGKRVLIVDADLRNPRIHQYLELSNEKGLTSLFSGATNPAVIQKFSEDPSIYVMCSGSYSIEPSRVFTSAMMKKLVKRMQHVFDLIIFDTPPLLGQSDAYMVANHTDGLLLVAHSGKVKQSHLSQAVDQLRTANVNVLGVVSREG